MWWMDLLDFLNSVFSGWGFLEGVDFEVDNLVVFVKGDVGSFVLENYLRIVVVLDFGIY